MKKFFWIFPAVVLAAAACFSFAVLAAGEGDYRENTGLYDSEEFLSAIGEEADFGNYTTACKLCYMEDRDFYRAAADGGIIEWAPEEYVWVISTKGGGETVFSLTDGGTWEMSSYRGPISSGRTGDTVNMDIVSQAVIDLSGGTESIADVPAVCVSAFHTNFVCFVSGGEEYFVPFGSRPDLTGLVNGQVYTAQKLVEALDVAYSGHVDFCENGGADRHNDGGDAGAIQSSSRTGMFVIALICIAVIAVCSVYIVVKRRKGRHNGIK